MRWNNLSIGARIFTRINSRKHGKLFLFNTSLKTVKDRKNDGFSNPKRFLGLLVAGLIIATEQMLEESCHINSETQQ